MSSTNQQKYESFNPLRQMFLQPFQRNFLQTLVTLHPSNVLEVGAGEGFLLDKIHRRIPQANILGLDINENYVAEGHRLFPQLDLQVGNIYHIQQPDKSWDVVVASEVLEHLDRPADGLRELARVARRNVLVSVPWEPWFRLLNFARGKHLSRWGNHPEHVNNWTRSSFIKLVSPLGQLTAVKSSFPWTIVAISM